MEIEVVVYIHNRLQKGSMNIISVLDASFCLENRGSYAESLCVGEGLLCKTFLINSIY